MNGEVGVFPCGHDATDSGRFVGRKTAPGSNSSSPKLAGSSRVASWPSLRGSHRRQFSLQKTILPTVSCSANCWRSVGMRWRKLAMVRRRWPWLNRHPQTYCCWILACQYWTALQSCAPFGKIRASLRCRLWRLPLTPCSAIATNHDFRVRWRVPISSGSPTNFRIDC
jgi:hypothetical protein